MKITEKRGTREMNKQKKNLLEFARYVVVGGISAVIDMAINYLMLYVIFATDSDNTPMVVISVTAGFVVGLLSNYILSNIFVFRSGEQKERGKTVQAFLIYGVVGMIGLGLTELLTVIGTIFISDSGFLYLVLTCFVKGVVLIWNYVGRKIFVYKEKIIPKIKDEV